MTVGLEVAPTAAINPNWPMRLFGTLIAVLLVTVVFATHAITRQTRNTLLLVGFQAGTSKLIPTELEKLKAAVERIRSEKWCTVDVVVVLGYAQPDEVPPERVIPLSKDRAAYVVSVIEQLGAPAARVFSEAKGIRPELYRAGEPTRNDARVSVEIVEGPERMTACARTAVPQHPSR